MFFNYFFQYSSQQSRAFLGECEFIKLTAHENEGYLTLLFYIMQKSKRPSTKQFIRNNYSSVRKLP